MGIATGIDFDKLMALRAKVAAWLAGECLHGSIAQAGLPKPLRAQLTPEKALA
jgi:hydroxymethylglutaryl-CoA lyase